MLEEALVCRRADSLRVWKRVAYVGPSLTVWCHGVWAGIRLLDTLVEKAELYQEPRIDTDLVLEFKFVTRSVKNIRMPLKTVPAHPTSFSVASTRSSARLTCLVLRHLRKEGRLPD